MPLIYVIPQSHCAIVERFGRFSRVQKAGIRFKIPLIERLIDLDPWGETANKDGWIIELTEQQTDTPARQCHTKDNVTVTANASIYWRIVDPLSSLINVADFAGALQGVATTTLRAVAGDMLLDDVLSKRDQVNDVLRVKLGEQTERWGGKVTTVEIRELVPPPDVQASMNRVLTAERTRRAVITESEGARQSKINVAEGEKQSAILTAEGRRQAAILEAEGYSQALTRIFEAARNIDDRTMTLQYFEALKELGQGESTKYVIPLELTDLARRLGNFIDSGLDSGAAMHVSLEGKDTADKEAGGSA